MMIRNRLLAATAAFAIASAQVSSGYGLTLPKAGTAPVGDSSQLTANTSFVSTAIANLQAYIVGLLGEKLSHVANMAAVAGWANTAFPVEVDGTTTAGDGGRRRMIFTAGTACAAPDGYTRVTSTVATGCWNMDASGDVSVRVFGIGLGGSDDSANWSAALAWAQTSRSHVLLEDIAGSTVAASSRIYVPNGTTIRSNAPFEGSDNPLSNMPNVTFTSATGGFTLGEAVSLANVSFTSSTADHCLEATGKFSYEHLRLNCANSGSLVTKNIVVGKAFVDGLGASGGAALPTGMTNGTYTKVAFNGDGTTTATVTVVVSGGTITSITPDGAGAVSLPYNTFGFAAGAIYSGSPAIANAGYMVTANTGRSRVHGLYEICPTSIGLEIDGGYDFVTLDDVHGWCNTTLSASSTSTLIRTGRVDGLSIINPKAYDFGFGIVSNGPGFVGGDFTTIAGYSFDAVNYGIQFTTPQANLAIGTGNMRAFNGCTSLNNSIMNFALTGMDCYVPAGVGSYVASASQFAISGNNYHSAAGASGAAYIQVAPTAALSSPAAQVGFVGSNNFDGFIPAVSIGQYAGQITIGPNSWPSTSSVAYLANSGANTIEMPTHGGQVGLTPNASGQATIATGLGMSPQQPHVEVLANVGVKVTIVSVSSTGVLTVQFNNANSGALVTSGTIPVVWSS